MTADKNSEKLQENAQQKSDKLRKRLLKTARRTTEEITRTKVASHLLDTIVEKNFHRKCACGTVKVQFNYGTFSIGTENFMSPTVLELYLNRTLSVLPYENLVC